VKENGCVRPANVTSKHPLFLHHWSLWERWAVLCKGAFHQPRYSIERNDCNKIQACVSDLCAGINPYCPVRVLRDSAKYSFLSSVDF